MSSEARGPLATCRRWWWVGLIALAVARFAVVVWSGVETNRGDFYATMPGAYVRTVNPELWASEDLSESWAFQKDEYLYGPVQYITLFPVLALAESYEEIAMVLLVVYLAVIGITVYLLWRAVSLIQPSPPWVGAALVLMAAFFFPLQKAYLQREFTIVVVCVTTAALVLLLRGRVGAAGAVIGYVTWFKFQSLVWVPYMILRRWWGGLAAFATTSAVVLGVTAATLGAAGFAPVREVILAQLQRRADVAGLCGEWTSPETHAYTLNNSTWVDLGWSLCSLGDRAAWFPSEAAYVLLLLGLGALFLAGMVRLERGTVDAAGERWRRAIEVGVLVMATATLVHAHYYYMSRVILPLGLLLARYLSLGARAHRARLALWAAAYLSLAAFAVPISVASQVTGQDFWAFYMHNNLYLPGQLLVFGLLYWEYFTIPVRRRAAQAPVAEAA